MEEHKEKIGKLYLVKQDENNWQMSTFWLPEYFSEQPVSSDHEIYSFPMLLLGFKEYYGVADLHLAKFLFEDKIYWTDWFDPGAFEERFMECSMSQK